MCFLSPEITHPFMFFWIFYSHYLLCFFLNIFTQTMQDRLFSKYKLFFLILRQLFDYLGVCNTNRLPKPKYSDETTYIVSCTLLTYLSMTNILLCFENCRSMNSSSINSCLGLKPAQFLQVYFLWALRKLWIIMEINIWFLY